MRAISAVGASSPILLFFLGGGVALHERLVGRSAESWDLHPAHAILRAMMDDNSGPVKSREPRRNCPYVKGHCVGEPEDRFRSHWQPHCTFLELRSRID